MGSASVKAPKESYKILLVEDNPGYANILQKRLSRPTNPTFHTKHAGDLQTAIEKLAKFEPHVILLDLSLPDSQGLETFTKIHSQASEVPVVILTSMDDERLALEALRMGAQDYVLKGEVSEKSILRVLHYAIERNHSQQELRSALLTDELTGLHNRRAFSILLGQQLRLARRTKKGMLFFFLDLDDFKQINDTYGHVEGDQALIQVAEILRSIFRKSDVIARMGGDEFAALAIEAQPGSTDITVRRLEEKLYRHNTTVRNQYKLSLSWGVTAFDPDKPCSMEAFMNAADRAMYQHKRSKRIASPQSEKRKRILIIEDADAFSKSIALRLRKSGSEVYTAKDGEEGLKTARRESPDLVILDLMLPKLSGEEVCKAIREDEDEKFASTPIIMLTAKNSEVDRIIGKMIGANDYVVKPFDPDSLLEKIRKVLVPAA